MKYLIFLKNRIGGGRFIAYFDSGYFHFNDNSGSRSVHQDNVKRSYKTTQ